MKKILLGLLAVVIAGGLVYAANDTFTITLSPTGDRGVLITTTTVGLGGMAPSEVKTTGAIPCTSTGTIANIEYEISAAVTGGTAVLTADADVTPVSTELCLQALFNAAVEAFAAKDVVTTVAQQVGDGAPGEFEGTDDDMDALGLLVSRNLWCQVTMPSAIDYTGTQTITVTVNAIAGE